MRYQPPRTHVQPCLTDEFKPVIIIPARPRSRFLPPRPAVRYVPLSTEERAANEAIRAQMAADDRAWLAEKAVEWQAKKQRLGL